MTMLLRAPEPSDLDSLYLWENDPQTWRVGFNQGPVSRKQLWEYLENYSSDIAAQGQLRLIITDSDSAEAAGTIDLTEYDPRHRRAQAGIYIAPAYRHRGLARKALEEIEQYCRNILGLHQLYAMAAADNEASRRLFAACGYTVSGRLRSFLRLRADSYTDVFIFQKLLTT